MTFHLLTYPTSTKIVFFGRGHFDEFSEVVGRGGEFVVPRATFLYSKYKEIRFLVSLSKGDVPNFIYIGFDLL